jgi:hypothetical protein
LLAEGQTTSFSWKWTYSSVTFQTYSEETEVNLSYLKQVNRPEKTYAEAIGDLTTEVNRVANLLESARGVGSLLVETPSQQQARIESNYTESAAARPLKRRFKLVLQWLLSKLN